MRADLKEVERVLAAGPAITPSPHFTASVMAAVRAEAIAPQLPFPWGRFLVGCALSAAIALLGSNWVQAHGELLDGLLSGSGPQGVWPTIAVALAMFASLLSLRLTRVP